MNERENLYEVLTHSGKAEWVPIVQDSCYTIIPSALHDRPTYTHLFETREGLKTQSSGTDWFGCKWYFDNAMHGFAQSPSDKPVIADISRWRENLKLPDLDAVNWEACAERDLKNYDRSKQMLRLFVDSGPFERLHQMHGFENTFIDMYEEQDAILEVMEVLTDFKIRMNNKLCQYYKPDIILTMDDLGSERGPLLSMDMYRKFIKPFDKRICEGIRENGVFAMYHSCGCMDCFVGDIADYGVVALHCLQGGINNQAAVQEKYGDELVFFDCLDNSVIHDPCYTEESLRNEVRRVIDLFKNKKNYVADTSALLPEQTKIIYDEAGKYGRYI